MTSQLYWRLSALSVLSGYCRVVNACQLPPVIPYDTILMLFRSTSPLGDRAGRRCQSPISLPLFHASRHSLMGHVCCGAFIQCGGNSATDLQAVRYRARANWIGPEPDSVLRSVRSLTVCHSYNIVCWTGSVQGGSEQYNLGATLQSRMADCSGACWVVLETGLLFGVFCLCVFLCKKEVYERKWDECVI